MAFLCAVFLLGAACFIFLSDSGVLLFAKWAAQRKRGSFPPPRFLVAQVMIVVGLASLPIAFIGKVEGNTIVFLSILLVILGTWPTVLLLTRLSFVRYCRHEASCRISQ